MKNKPKNPDAWWQNAYSNQEHISVFYELSHEKDVIKPGSRIKIKNTRGVFIFRCMVHNQNNDVTWVDVIDESTKEWRSFEVGKVKGLVKMRSRRRKVNV